MAHEFRLQDPGEGIHEAEILEIPVKKGDHVSEGDTVVVAETDKAAVEIPAPVDGEVLDIRVKVGDIATVGDVLMVFDEDGAGSEDDDTDEDGADKKRGTAADDGQEADDAETAKEGAPKKSARKKARQGREDAEDADDDSGSGEVEAKSEPSRSTSTRDSVSSTVRKVRATPSVRGLAREMGVDLSEIDGSGEDGRILEDDVKDAAGGEKGGEKDGEKRAPTKGEKVVELRSLRRTMARRMAQAWLEIPHVTHQDMIEITALERLRRKHAEEIGKLGGALTLTPFIVKALAIALTDFPNFNATFDADACAVHQMPDYNIGVALDTERGLLVPVLRDAGRKSITELALDLSKLGERLRANFATPEDLRGATFTLTNLGAIGGTGLAPIINPPQTAIFGTARAELRQMVRGDIDDHTIEVALCLPVCLTFDHRVADGAEAARFVGRVKALLDDPGELVLNT